MNTIEQILQKIYSKKTLHSNEMQTIFDSVMSGEMDNNILSSVLTILYMRGETAEEISGAARGMLNNAKEFPRPEYSFGDIVGTGGGDYNTINISTTSAIIGVGCGLRICKHGNRKVTSLSGSADVLSELGLDLNASPEKSRQLLDNAGICFLMAPNYHLSVKHATSVRKSLKFRTIFNILGPLINPSRPDYIVNGAFDRDLLPTIAFAHKYLGLKQGAMVHGSGLDEVCLHGKTDIVELMPNGNIEAIEVSPSDFGLPEINVSDIEGGNPQENAQVIRDIINNEGKEEHVNVVSANVALLLRTASVEPDLKKGVDIAKEAIVNGKAKEALAVITE